MILKALLFYKYNLEYVADVFANSEEEKQTELAKVTYTYEQISSYKVEQLSKLLNFSPNCIYKNLRNLKAKGIVERIGSNKNGYWKILK